MYQVFVNDIPLTLSNQAMEDRVNIEFKAETDAKKALNKILEEQIPVNLVTDNLAEKWPIFVNQFRVIEAAGGMVFNQNQEILFIYRLGKWDLPKGKMEIGEDVATTAIREVEEECGISNLKITKTLETTYHIYYLKEFILKFTHWFAMDYAENEELIPQTEEDITQAKWFAQKELEIPLSNTYQNILTLFSTKE